MSNDENKIEKVQEKIKKLKHIFDVTKGMRNELQKLCSECDIGGCSYDLYSIDDSVKKLLDAYRIKLADLRGE